MDPSALIFVALAVAWAVYLIPKALEHHGEGERTRTIDRFSSGLRVLARREAVSRREAVLVVGDGPVVGAEPEPVAPLTPAQLRARRRAAALAAKRRLRVVTIVLLANVVVAALAAFSVIGWVWCAVPAGLLVAWLVACRLMVKRERAARRPVGRPTARPAERRPAPAPEPDSARIPVVGGDETGVVPVVSEAPAEAPADAPAPAEEPATAERSWDPVPVTLPTYVTKAVAPRTVSTIDLDSTGVWSSGRKAADSALAREAAEAEAEAKKAARQPRKKASGS
ncbi:divisome protein SepX/GlpR [Nocardioides flavescens]|uniref:Uncharacterized protein n=1 Tax=Nocardioides flavescens TaxID=2691959 RepID=A0A6L7F273_9ACTN|nr:hypothetical protein [Nocardioides flavescens]MXG91609.1 hypothetical protein [Nocardioides flavescens]